MRTAVVAVLLADLQEHRRLDCARVDRDSGDDHARDIGDRERNRAVDRGQCGVAHTQDHGVSALDRDALPDIVNARCEQKVLAARQLIVDRLDGVRRSSDEEVAERDGFSWGHAAIPGDAAGIRLCRRHPDVVLALRVEEQVGLLTANRRGLEGRVWRVWEAFIGGRAFHASKDLIPHSI